MMFAEVLAVIFSNFALVMFILAIIAILIHKGTVVGRIPTSEIVFRWMVLIGLGFTGVFAFIMHLFFPQMASAAIGWTSNPFEYEVAMADLALGILGILSFKASFDFRLATVIAASICFWGDALGHLYQIAYYQNYAVGNAGSWLWMDVLIPLILWIALLNLKKRSK